MLVALVAVVCIVALRAMGVDIKFYAFCPMINILEKRVVNLDFANRVCIILPNDDMAPPIVI